MKKLLLVPLLLAATPASATDIAYAPPLGGNAIVIAGATGGVPKVTTFTPALRMPVTGSFVGRARGTLTTVAATDFTDIQAGWSAGALSQAAAPYFVRIRSGAAAGTWWQVSTTAANTPTDVTILNRNVSPLTLGMAPGDVYEIVPGDTLANLLGSFAPSIGGTSATTADAVRVHDGVNWREYYYNSTVAQWREGAATFDRSATVIPPDSGVVFVRQGAGNITLLMLGTVSDANERVLVNPTGVTVVGSVFPVARTLGSLNIQGMSGFVNYTGDITAADQVTVFDGVNWRTFQYNPGVSQWREGASTFNRNSFALPFGSPVIIERGNGVTGGAVEFTLQIPYTL